MSIALATFAPILGGKEAWGYLVEFHAGAKRPIRSLLLGFYALKPTKNLGDFKQVCYKA
jgi:hypothetical protein